ncbi:MAG: hypothetical protein QXI09_03660 [Candidatus Aenigmatarchaeota archaeon]
MSSLRTLEKILFEAKNKVEDWIKEEYKIEKNLPKPIIISAKEIEAILNNTKPSIEEIEIICQFPTSNEELRLLCEAYNENRSMEIDITQEEKIDEIVKIISSYLKNRNIEFSYETKKISNDFGTEGKIKLRNCFKINFFLNNWKCSFGDIYELSSFLSELKKKYLSEKIFSCFFYSIKDEKSFEDCLDENYKEVLKGIGSNLEYIFKRFVSLRIIYDESERRFKVVPWSNAENNRIFVRERLEELTPEQIFGVGVHEFLHNIEEKLFESISEEECKVLNDIILRRINEFCEKNRLTIIKQNNFEYIILTPHGEKINVTYMYGNDGKKGILKASLFHLTKEALVESETIRICEKYGLNSENLKKVRIKELNEMEEKGLRGLIIYAGYLSGDEFYKQRKVIVF